MNRRNHIIEYIAPHVTLFPTQFALVFGTRHGIERFADDIVSLYVQRYMMNVIISGGSTAHRVESEASVLHAALLSRGIPNNAIFIEDKAVNTGQNVTFSREKFKHFGLQDLLLVGKISSKRRYLMTVRKQWPEIRTVCCHGVNYFRSPVVQWWKDREFRARVIAEYRKIPSYVERGLISEVSIINGVVL